MENPGIIYGCPKVKNKISHLITALVLTLALALALALVLIGMGFKVLYLCS